MIFQFAIKLMVNFKYDSAHIFSPLYLFINHSTYLFNVFFGVSNICKNVSLFHISKNWRNKSPESRQRVSNGEAVAA